MGNKIITEKDFWMCTTGAVPAQLQGTRLGTKKKSGEVYITVEDKATSSFIDFGCTKYMLLAALAVAAAVVVLAVVGVLTVATGGAALIALGAVAGLVGAAIGGIVGGLLCGQKVASKRVWSGNKSNLISQGTKTITGDHTMTCAAGGTITFAPQIKNWSQAVALGGANYLGKLMEGMMAGAAVGMGGAILSGGAGAVATGGMRGLGQATLQFAKTIPSNVMTNYLATWTTGIGLGLRGITTIESTARAYGETGEVGASDVAKGVFGMEVGTAHSATNIVNGQPGWQDIVGLALWMSPVAKGLNEGRVNSEARRARGNGEAYEARLGERRVSDDIYNELRDQTPTQEIRDMVNEGVTLPMPDFALPGLEITKRLHADHIVSMDKIAKMEGFDLLTKEQQLEVLNNSDNFTGLSPSANTSKGAKSFTEWTEHKSKGIEVDPVFREEMMLREQQLEGQLQRQIDTFLNIN